MRDLTDTERRGCITSSGWIKAYLWASLVHQCHNDERLHPCAAAAFAFLRDGGTLDSGIEDLGQWAKAYPLAEPEKPKPMFAKKGAAHAHA